MLIKADKMKHLESYLQQACVKWFDLQYPKEKLRLFSIPNEGARTQANGARMKAQGRRAGVADMFLMTFCRKGIFFEFKKDLKSKQTDNQIAFQKEAESYKYKYIIITNFQQFVEIVSYELAFDESAVKNI